ncbi:MAG: hypothetical protein R2691_09020 [Solirubrobacterales bacterium]
MSWTRKDIRCLERHSARTIEGLCERVGARVLALAAFAQPQARSSAPRRVDFVA